MCHTHSGLRKSAAAKIEVRLREPSVHDFKSYEEEIVGTICHELSHIVHGNHSAEFYKLMDVLRDEFEATRGKAGVDGLGAFTGAGYKVDTDRHNPKDPLDARRLAAAAAERRAAQQFKHHPDG